MRRIILLFLAGSQVAAELPQFHPDRPLPEPPPHVVIPKVVPPRVAPQRMPAGPVSVPAGWHVHRCAHGHEWAHPDRGFVGNVHAHTCPECGMQSWNPVRHGPTTLALAARPALSAPPAPVASVRQTLYICSTNPCPHCVSLERSMEDADVKRALAAYDVRRLSTSDPKQAEEIDKLGVTRFPTLVIVEADGSRFWLPLEGHRDPRPLAFWLREAVHRPLTGSLRPSPSPQIRTAPPAVARTPMMATRYCPPGRH